MALRWEYFTEERIFKNHRDENYQPLGGEDALDAEEIVRSARAALEKPADGGRRMKFLRLLSGYRMFNPLRGMEYIVDLAYTAYSTTEGNAGRRQSTETHRVQLIRPLYSMELLAEVPYVKEDTDITIVTPPPLPPS